MPGYWDHDISHRGVMFAPVCFDRPVYGRPGYAYSPSVVIDFGVVATCLFVQPRSHHYYFGDYYDRRCEERGYRPWYTNEVRHRGDDPLYVQYRAQQLRRDPNWDTHVREQFSYRREHVEARPPQTLAIQVNLFNTRKVNVPEDMHIGRTLADVAASRILPVRLSPVNADERRQFERNGRELRRFQLDRAKLELEAAPAAQSSESPQAPQPASVKLPESPVAAKPLENAEGAKAPPPLPVAPTPQVTGPEARPEPLRKLEETVIPPQPVQMPAVREPRSAAMSEEPKPTVPQPETAAPNTELPKTEAAPPAKREKPNRREVPRKIEETVISPQPETAAPNTEPPKTEAMPPAKREKPNRREAPWKTEETLSPSQPLQMPAVREPRSAAISEEPKPMTPNPGPQKIEAMPPATGEKPNRMETKPERPHQPEGLRVAPKMESAPGEMNPDRRQMRRAPESVESHREPSDKPEGSTREMRQPQAESKGKELLNWTPGSKNESRPESDGGKHREHKRDGR